MTQDAKPRHGERPGTGTATPRSRGWVPVRTLGEADRAAVTLHLLTLGDADRIWRFGHRVSDERIAHYAAQIDFERDEVFGTFDRRLVLVGLGHLALDTATGTGEFGVSVHPRARGHGLGAQLFEHAVTHARNRHVRTLTIHLARDNKAMLSIVQRAGAAINFEAGDAVAELTLPADTLGSQLEELLVHQAAEFDFRLKVQSLRATPPPATGL